MAGLKAPEKLFERDVGVAGAFCDVVVIKVRVMVLLTGTLLPP